jgi:hypothetical protein
MSISATKTIVNTSAALFAGNAVQANRTFMRVRNMDDCMAIVVGGRTVEPGEVITFNFKASTPETVMAYSKGRAVQVEVVEA